MTNLLSLREDLEPFVTLSLETGLITAYQAFESRQVSFAVIGSPAQVLLSREDLEEADLTDDLTIADFFDPLPPIIAISADWEVLSAEQVGQFVEYASERDACGIVVYEGDETIGILSAERLANALPAGIIRVSKGTRSIGNSAAEPQTYICMHCDNSLTPASGDDVPPLCPRSSRHGPMELES